MHDLMRRGHPREVGFGGRGHRILGYLADRRLFNGHHRVAGIKARQLDGGLGLDLHQHWSVEERIKDSATKFC